MSGRARPSIVVLGVVHLGAGLAMALRPGQVVVAAVGSGGHHRHGADAPPAPVVRVLGARYAVQGLVEMAAPRGGVALAGAVVDVLHASSMAPAARVWPRFARAALISASAATLSAAVGWALSRRAR